MPTLKRLKELFTYDRNTGHLLSNKTTSFQRKEGEPVGGKKGNGYWMTYIDGVNYYNHRLVWYIHNGLIPKNKYVDHINRNRMDNRIENLRLVSFTGNTQNASIRSDNSSGVRGVSWFSPTKKWRARIKVNKKEVCLGYFKEFSDAIRVRKAAENKYHI